MRVYKYKDTSDGNYAFILAKSEADAEKLVSNTTTLYYNLVESRDVEELDYPISILNNILPF